MLELYILLIFLALLGMVSATKKWIITDFLIGLMLFLIFLVIVILKNPKEIKVPKQKYPKGKNKTS